MVERVVCPKCNRASYTTAPEVFGPCPYCGFIFNWRSPDRRIFDRAKTNIPLTINKNGSVLAGNTMDISKRGAAVIAQNTFSLKEGDEVMCSFKDDQKEGKDSTVVWAREDGGKQMVGLLFS
ncbi:MAG: PilZ domain-containing protein [Thermodesulfobacteriota bacterium]